MQRVFVIINGASPHPRVAIVVVGCRWGLWLAAARCRHWGYMGVATYISRAPHPYVIVGGTWGRGSHCPRRIGRGAVLHFGGGATLPPNCRGWDHMQLATHIGGGHPGSGIVMAVIGVAHIVIGVAHIVIVAWVTRSSWLG